MTRPFDERCFGTSRGFCVEAVVSCSALRVSSGLLGAVSMRRVGRPRGLGCATCTGASTSRCAGLRQSIETTSVRFPTTSLNVLTPASRTAKAPSYGHCSGGRWLSRRTKTNWALFKLVGSAAGESRVPKSGQVRATGLCHAVVAGVARYSRVHGAQ